MENNNEVVTKNELKNMRLIDKLEDNVQALTDFKKQVEKENEKLTGFNDRLKRENFRLNEQNREIKSDVSELRRENADLREENASLTSWISDQKKEYGTFKSESDKKISALQIELKTAIEKIAEQSQIIAQKSPTEFEQKATVEKTPEQSVVSQEKEKENEFLKFLAKPIISDEDLIQAGATVDKWNGTALLNNVRFKKQFMKNDWKVVS